MSKELNNVFVNSKMDSFSDRIYDDLCEDILKWLSIDDKIKLTEVSKQFQRCLQSLRLRQKVLTIDCETNSDVYDSKTLLLSNGWSTHESLQNGIEKILKIFPNINEFHLERIPRYQIFTNIILRAIVNQCSQLKIIAFPTFNCSSQVIKEFGQKFGQNFQSISVSDRTTQNFKPLISLSPHLLSINNIYFINLFENNEVLVKKLRKLKTYGVSDNLMFNKFIDNNPLLTDLNINFSFEKNFHRTDGFAKLAQFRHLKILKISFSDCITYDQNIVKSIETIAKNCKNLKSFGLEVETRKSFDTKHCFQSFKHFSGLKRFYLNSHDSSTPNPIPTQRLNSYCLSNCKQLTHLELMSDQIDDNFFIDIDSVFPNLKHLVIGMINENITDISLESLTKLIHLESLLIKCLDSYRLTSITDSGLQKLFNGCNGLHTFGVFNKMIFTETTLEILIRKALKNPLIFYKYYLRAFEDFVNIEEVIKRSGYNRNNIVITGSMHVFDKINDFN